MKLRDLSPTFLTEESPGVYVTTDDIAAAVALHFLCPECTRSNAKHVHGIRCPRKQWDFRGTGYDDLSLVAAASSVRITGGCYAHFFINSGNIEFCGDSGLNSEPRRQTVNVKIGDQIKFNPTHNKALVLTGRVDNIEDDGSLHVIVPPDGNQVEIEHLQTIGGDCILEVIETAEQAAEKAAAEQAAKEAAEKAAADQAAEKISE